MSKKKMQIFVFGEALSPANYSRKQCQLLVLKYVTMVIHYLIHVERIGQLSAKLWPEKQLLEKFLTCLVFGEALSPVKITKNNACFEMSKNADC